MRNKFCRVRRLTAASEAAAAEEAARINPDNAREEQLRMAPGRRGGPRRIVVVRRFRWPTTGVKLSVQFLDSPDAQLRRHILAHMNAWSKFANVKFTETRSTGEVRIARYDHPPNEAGYWSWVGTQIRRIALDMPTMNLDSFTMDEPESEFKRVVRHEAGHTLGFDHEHMRGDIVSRINRTKAYKHFYDDCGWTKKDVDAQVLTPLSERSVFGTSEADPLSIMCYQLPGAIMTDGIEVPGGADINRTDAAFAGSLYPKRRGGRR